MTTDVKRGKANYSDKGGSKFPERPVYYKLGHRDPKDRTMIVRMAPPVKNLADAGKWAVYLKTHWGYGFPVTTKTGERKNIPCTFLCVEHTDRNGNILTSCPECVEIRARKAKVDADASALKQQGKSDADIEFALSHARKWLKDHSLDKKWHILAKDQSGKWGVLLISHTCYKRLQTKFSDLQAAGIDPLDENKGVWFKFYREGTKFNEIEDYPEPVMEEGADGALRRKFDAMTDADWQQIAVLPGLDELGRSLDSGKIAQIVESAGDEIVLRAVTNQPVLARNDAPQEEPGAVEAASASPDPAVVAEPSADDEVARLQAMLAAAQAKKAAVAPAVAAPAQTTPVNGQQPAAAIQNAMGMPMDEFLAMFGRK